MKLLIDIYRNYEIAILNFRISILLLFPSSRKFIVYGRYFYIREIELAHCRKNARSGMLSNIVETSADNGNN